MRFRTHTIPEKAHPLVKRLFTEMNTREVTMLRLSIDSGVSIRAIDTWRRSHTPNLVSLEACFNALGLSLQPEPIAA